jgi:hypothetical protein
MMPAGGEIPAVSVVIVARRNDIKRSFQELIPAVDGPQPVKMGSL